jgi:hypothetical protein
MDAVLVDMFVQAKRRTATNVPFPTFSMNTETSTAASQVAESATLPSKKVFKVAVDDSTLILGLKRNTRDGIRRWVGHGAIQLFIPLHSKKMRLKTVWPCTNKSFQLSTV